jgi:hypothetical protein
MTKNENKKLYIETAGSFTNLIYVINCRAHAGPRGGLKVPKREIFDRSDFPDFYTIKPLRVGDFGVKIQKIFENI